jgi:transcriptional regulator with XRE-family HTH domain
MATMTAAKKQGKTAAPTMTEKEVIQLMKTTQGEQSLRTFANEIGVTPAYLSDIYNGRRSPGPAVLQFFNIGKTRRVIVEYVFFKK